MPKPARILKPSSETVTTKYWPPTITDLQKACTKVEKKGAKVAWVTVAHEDNKVLDYPQIDRTGSLPTFRGARISTHVRNTPGIVTVIGDLVTKKGPMYNRRYRVEIVWAGRVKKTCVKGWGQCLPKP